MQTVSYVNITFQTYRALEKQLWKATSAFVISAYLSVLPSVRMELLGSKRTDFREILY
jgi:hypothetical protein